MSRRRRVGVLALAATLVIIGVAGGVVVASGPTRCAGCASAVVADGSGAKAVGQPRSAAVVNIVPASRSVGVDPLAPVNVSAASGQLIDVVMRNELGNRIEGITTPDRTSWKPGVPLGYGRSYTVTATALGDDGNTRQTTSSFSTLTPGNQTNVTLSTTGGAEIDDGGTYGVGTVVVARFDEPIAEKAAAERRMTVTTEPPVSGSWYWLDDQTAHWRPPQYFSPGTSVTVAAEVYGVPLGDGLYGQEDTEVRFTIGDSHISIADDVTKLVSVYDNGRLVRTMPTSMGMGGSETINGQTISFWTQRGIYTVMGKANPVVMDSSTFGLPVNSRLGYKESINFATRISTDGVYLHQLDSTVWAQGNTNVSHGCLNLNADNARWFYEFSQPGDVVEVRNTGGEPLQVWQNGDWSLPWDQWMRGSALL